MGRAAGSTCYTRMYVCTMQKALFHLFIYFLFLFRFLFLFLFFQCVCFLLVCGFVRFVSFFFLLSGPLALAAAWASGLARLGRGWGRACMRRPKNTRPPRTWNMDAHRAPHALCEMLHKTGAKEERTAELLQNWAAAAAASTRHYHVRAGAALQRNAGGPAEDANACAGALLSFAREAPCTVLY